MTIKVIYKTHAVSILSKYHINPSVYNFVILHPNDQKENRIYGIVCNLSPRACVMMENDIHLEDSHVPLFSGANWLINNDGVRGNRFSILIRSVASDLFEYCCVLAFEN
jgi:hypothetical protein